MGFFVCKKRVSFFLKILGWHIDLNQAKNLGQQKVVDLFN